MNLNGSKNSRAAPPSTRTEYRMAPGVRRIDPIAIETTQEFDEHARS